MKTAPRAVIVSAMPGVVGRAFPADQFLDAVELSARAKALGFEGKIVVAFDDDTMREFNPATKGFGAELSESPFQAAAALPDSKAKA